MDDNTDDEPLAEVPGPGADLDDETVSTVESWIETLHPEDCVPALDQLHDARTSDYDSAKALLTAHVVDEHGLGVVELAETPKPIFREDVEGPLLDAIARQEDRLIENLFENWEELGEHPAGPWCANLIFRSISEDAFEASWERLWESDLPERSPRLTEAIARIVVFGDRGPEAERFITGEFDRLADIMPSRLGRWLARIPSLRENRHQKLSEMIDIAGVDAARAVIKNAKHPDHPTPAVVDATKLLLEEGPESTDTTLGLVLSLDVDPEFARPRLVERFHTSGSYDRFDHECKRLLRELASSSLFEALAQDAMDLNEGLHAHLGERHERLFRDVALIKDWLEDREIDDENHRYVAGLLVSSLSRASQTEADVESLIEASEELHVGYGHRDRQDVLESAGLTDPNMSDFDRLAAIELAKDVRRGPEDLDVDEVLERLQEEYPYTYQALGGSTLDGYLRDGDRFPWIYYYQDGYEDELETLRPRVEDLPDDEIPDLLDSLRYDHLTKALAFREIWEDRFKAIEEAGITIKERRLREQASYWVELVFLEALLSEFDIEVEPEDLPGLEEKRPEFLLQSPDGDLIFEVTKVSRRPKDVPETTRASSGVELQKKVDKKWSKKFKECEVDPGLPVVIAVQAQGAHELEFDMLNSLYGKQAFSWTQETDTGEVVAEGSSRDREVGFFNRSDTECISAVAGVAPSDPRLEYLYGELHRPMKEPWNPLSPDLRVRLRTALFGPRPSWLVERMASIPTITEEEVVTLVDHGVDNLSFFAAGRIPRPDGLPISESRYEELVQEARRLARIRTEGRLEYFRAAEDRDLSPLHDAGIYTANQLVAAEAKPAECSQDLWDELLAEAHELGYEHTRGWGLGEEE